MYFNLAEVVVTLNMCVCCFTHGQLDARLASVREISSGQLKSLN